MIAHAAFFLAVCASFGTDSDDDRRRRAEIVALNDEGVTPSVIAAFLGCSVSTVYRWLGRVDVAASAPALADAPRSGRPPALRGDVQMRLTAFYCQTRPPWGAGRWSIRYAEDYLGDHPEILGQPISRSSIQRILSANRLKPHLSKYFLQITDPDFFPKMEHITHLYLHRPEHLFCFDECPGIQVLQRLAPDVAPRPSGRTVQKWLEEFEYIRHGTTDLFAFLDAGSGQVSVEFHANHTMKTFLSVFKTHAVLRPRDDQIHYVMDNLACHASYKFCRLVATLSRVKCPSEKKLSTAALRRAWLQRDDKRIVVHFTPFHGSWLNMVEVWFSILAAKILKESFVSPDALREAVLAFAAYWDAHLAHPFQWEYTGEGLHANVVKRFTTFIETAGEQMDHKLLLKQFGLITNLIQQYWEQTPTATWAELGDCLRAQESALRRHIAQDNRPRRQASSDAALDGLLCALAEALARTP